MNEPDAVTIACAHRAQLGESPLWHPQRRQMFWLDIDGRAVLAIDVVSGDSADEPVPPQIWPLPEAPGCIGLVARAAEPSEIDPDYLVVSLRSGFFRLDLRDETLLRLSPPLFDGRQFRFNDGKVDPRGRFWAGTMYEPKGKPLGGLYRLDRGRACAMTGPDANDVQRREWGVATSNGLAFSPDGRTMYHVDTPTHTIQAYDFDLDSGEPSNRRDWWRTPDNRDAPDYAGRPDGAAIDADGFYWSAQYQGRRIVRLDPNGRVEQSIALPVRSPTMPAFGGDDLRTLFITSQGGDGPCDGMLMKMRVRRPGLAPVGYVQH